MSKPYSPLTRQERLDQAIAEHYIELHNAINTFASEDSAGGTMEVLTETLYGWLIESLRIERESEVNYTKDYTLRQRHLDTIWSTFRLMVFATKVKEGWNTIESLEASKKEVSHE